jgi:hypothetical protein
VAQPSAAAGQENQPPILQHAHQGQLEAKCPQRGGQGAGRIAQGDRDDRQRLTLRHCQSRYAPLVQWADTAQRRRPECHRGIPVRRKAKFVRLAGQLGHSQWISRGYPHHLVRLTRLWHPAGELREQLCGLAPVEAGQAVLRELSEVEHVRFDRRHDHADRVVAEPAHSEHDRFPRRRVEPLGVVNRDQQGLLLRQGRQQA